MEEILSVFVLIAADQLSKVWAIHAGVAVLNTGIALSLFQGSSMALLLAVAGIVLVAYLYRDTAQKRSVTPADYLAFTLVLAGGLSNLIDRFLYAGVVDFIHLWIIPTFNLADAMISTGIVLLIGLALYYEYLSNGADNRRRSGRQAT